MAILLKKRFLSVLLTIIMVLFLSPVALAADPVKIIVNDQEIKTGSTPVLENGRVLVPLRAVTQTLGSSVNWDNKTQTATVKKWCESLIFNVAKKTVIHKGELNEGEEPQNTTLKVIQKQIYVPLGIIAQYFDYQVNWNGKAVLIDSPLSDQTADTLYQSDLFTARKVAIQLAGRIGHNLFTPLTPNYDFEDLSSTYLFPQGEVLRFFLIHGKTVSLYEFRDDFPIVIWQAYIYDNTVESFFNQKFTDPTGDLPQIDKEYFYYASGFMGESSWEECGRIDTDGKNINIGYEYSIGGDVYKKDGVMTYFMPGETRTDQVKE